MQTTQHHAHLGCPVHQFTGKHDVYTLFDACIMSHNLKTNLRTISVVKTNVENEIIFDKLRKSEKITNLQSSNAFLYQHQIHANFT